MAKKIKNKKLFLGVLAVIAIALLGMVIALFVNAFNTKSYDIDELKDSLVVEYKDLHLTEMDKFDVLELFGFDKSEVEDALFLKSFEMDASGNDVTDEVNYVVVMNTKNHQEYYEIFESHVDSYLKYTEDKNEYNAYNKAIIKNDRNYVYLIISTRSKEIEMSINEQ